MRFATSPAAALLASVSLVAAQTFTDCNPLEKTCPKEVGLPSASYLADFAQGSSAASSWTAASGTKLDYGSDGAVFTIASEGQSPTIASDFYIFFGRYEVTMKAAPGTGIVSSIVMESADLDEIDWEFIGGDSGHVQSNFYGKGNTTTYDRVVYHPVANTQSVWHTYAVDWTSERIEFSIDGTVVRTVPYSSPLALGGQNYPQTPMKLKLGSWAGGSSSSEGTVEWAGGKTDYSQGPFKMYIKSVNVINYNPACEYSYSDHTGSWQSIDVVKSGDACNAQGAASSAPVTQPAVGTATAPAQTTVTSAPTASQSVAPIMNTVPSFSTTVTGSSYSINTASIAALNSGVPTGATATTMATMPTQSGTGSNSPSSTTSSGIAQFTGAASVNTLMTGGSLLSVVLCALLL